MRLLAVIGLFLCLQSATQAQNVVCYYDSASYLRAGLAKFQLNDLEIALQFCTHLFYGYAGLTPSSFEVYSLHVDLDMFHYQEVTTLKRKFPNLKIYLSVGGDKDYDDAHPMKYIELLESGPAQQQNFIDSAITLLRHNGFDGLDLAFQFPKNKPRKVHGTIGTYWKKFKKLFTGNFIVDKNATLHKEQYTEFTKNLNTAMRNANLSLAMTVLPNVNSTWYFDVPVIKNYFDIVNLCAFDFLTPERNPEEADYTSPIEYLPEENRLPHYNIEYQIQHWLSQNFTKEKLYLGIASYGRAWTMSIDSGLTGVPVVVGTEGAAPPGLQSQIPGLFSWPEICSKLPNDANANYRGKDAPLRKVTDIEHKHGNYALRPADENGEYGMWISFDDPDFAGTKTYYAKSKGLGGIALYDLSYDDFRGLCTGQKFPILRSIKINM